ncbi:MULTISPECIES: Mth938-like domain-containing protein [unclassified Paracoccus (in: a-proteobacteria)]|uniref:Mth938-like domain-containing protein n=1 Tax=unclassified Paracoccus (in: a-proteobacteria) TaxID=2688777 RepID=UPI0012B20D1B|nr:MULTISPECIES: Mth938-like domain-containing protein [unclassified Paracoccus (in: a-proteobacteria)]UXU74527.1 Mth938-like domain-containing protein [Paracoccus sp. SMMA_5]UXU80420.1 Mth938-like domain-containing protein [Paracoccus sp. SMMA_5_TC]
MANMVPTEFLGAVPIDGYGPGFFRVGGVVHRGAVIVTASGVTPWGGLEDRAALLALAGQIDVLFLGMGADIALPSAELRAALDRAGLMAEPMNTPSAARSYNVTLSEGRRVACALLPV